MTNPINVIGWAIIANSFTRRKRRVPLLILISLIAAR